MVRIQCVIEYHWMTKIAPEPEALIVKITTQAEAAHTRDALYQKPMITKEEVLYTRYPNPAHQKEVYQDTIGVLRNLQGEIQYLKEKKKASEIVQTGINDLREVCKMLHQENIIPILGSSLKGNTPHARIETGWQIRHVNLPPDSIDYEKEITLNVVVDGWLLSNILIDTGAEVNVLTLDVWVQMGRPPLQLSSNVLFMENRTKATPIGVLKDASITIQGAKFTVDFEVLALVEVDSFPSFLGCPQCYVNNVDLRFNKGYIIFENKEERFVIPLTDGKSTPYGEPLSEEDLNKIYVCVIHDPEVNEPSKEGIIQWEDSHFISDTMIITCDNWAHGTYELVGCKVKSTVTCKNGLHFV